MREHPAARTPSVNPTPAPPVRQSLRPVARPPTSNAAVVAGVTLSHPDKMFFPESNLSKRAVAEYYEKIGEWMIPHLRDRPLSLVRCPDGWRSACHRRRQPQRLLPAARNGSPSYNRIVPYPLH
jgi:bifunctional non-homologous end joining protein LigD